MRAAQARQSLAGYGSDLAVQNMPLSSVPANMKRRSPERVQKPVREEHQRAPTASSGQPRCRLRVALRHGMSYWQKSNRVRSGLCKAISSLTMGAIQSRLVKGFSMKKGTPHFTHNLQSLTTRAVRALASLTRNKSLSDRLSKPKI